MTTLRISIPPSKPGQHVCALRLPANSSPIYSGRLRWARRHEVIGDHALYFVEYWGGGDLDGPVVNDLTMAASTDAGPEFALDPAVKPAVFAGPKLVIDGSQAAMSNVGSVSSPGAISMSYRFTLPGWSSAQVRLLALARHPVLYCAVRIKSDSNRLPRPHWSPVHVHLAFGEQGEIATSGTGSLLDCNLVMQFALPVNPNLEDPSGERKRALLNAGPWIRGVSGRVD